MQVNPPYRDMGGVMLSEPRINALKSMLETILQVVVLEKDGQAVDVNGFRLRNLEDWVISSGTPLSPDMLLDSLAAGCNVSCRFCYVKGNPPGWTIPMMPRNSLKDELLTRLRYYDEETGQYLFRTMVQWYEPFNNPYIMEILKLVRSQSCRWITLTTNGKGLTEPIIAQLATLKPVYVVLSLNTTDPAMRVDVMRDRTPDIAIKAPQWLRDYEIPFAISCVPWPTVPNSYLQECLLYGDAAGAESLRVSLPGYTRYNAAAAVWFDTQQYWTDLVEALAPLRHQMDAPLLFYPYLFEESLRAAPHNRPRVVGVGRNSPARTAGFGVDDVILAINGTNIVSRPHGRDQLRSALRSGVDDIVVTVERNGHAVQLRMEDTHNYSRYGYPYGSEHGPSNPSLAPFGLFIPSGFRHQTLTLLKQTIRESGARRVLVTTTRLMEPLLKEVLSQSDFRKGLEADIHFVIPQNQFLGGGIMMGDLLVNSDIIACINEFTATQGRPDLVCLSSSMFTPSFGWLRDLNGRFYKEIERTTGIPVQLIPHDIIAW